MIVLRNVWYKYPNSNEYALKKLTFEFKGKSLLIQGPYGSGITTLLKVIACMIKPDRGEILINGVNPWKLSSRDRLLFRRSIIYVHEKPVFLRGTVLDNLVYPLRIRGCSKRESVEKSLKRLRELNIKDVANKKVNALSMGQSKLASLARALVIEPKYLLLDEPLSNLDESYASIVVKALKSLLLRETRILIASHIKVPSELIDSKLTLFQGEASAQQLKFLEGNP